MHARVIAQKLAGRLLGDDVNLCSMAPLFCAQSSQISVVMWPKDVMAARKTKAGCLVCNIDFAASFADEVKATLIVVDDFFVAFQILNTLMTQGEFGGWLNINRQQISATAKIHQSATVLSAQIGDNTYIGPQVFIDNNVIIGDNNHIAAGSVIYGQTRIGDYTEIGPRTVVGSEAFVPYGVKPTKNLCSLGGVEIGHRTLIKAGCTIDRGLIGNTQIGNNCLIDNLVHVGHDGVIGENVVIAAQSGMAGFVQVGDDVTIGGQSGFAPHAQVGVGARISGKTLIHGRVKPYEVWSGSPGLPHEIYLRTYKKNLRDARIINDRKDSNL